MPQRPQRGVFLALFGRPVPFVALVERIWQRRVDGGEQLREVVSGEAQPIGRRRHG